MYNYEIAAFSLMILSITGLYIYKKKTNQIDEVNKLFDDI